MRKIILSLVIVALMVSCNLLKQVKIVEVPVEKPVYDTILIEDSNAKRLLKEFEEAYEELKQEYINVSRDLMDCQNKPTTVKYKKNRFYYDTQTINNYIDSLNTLKQELKVIKDQREDYKEVTKDKSKVVIKDKQDNSNKVKTVEKKGIAFWYVIIAFLLGVLLDELIRLFKKHTK